MLPNVQYQFVHSTETQNQLIIRNSNVMLKQDGMLIDVVPKTILIFELGSLTARVLGCVPGNQGARVHCSWRTAAWA